MCDTDSFMYHIETEDMYKDMKDNSDRFDLSDYPPNHFMYNAVNKKQLGVMKDELAGHIALGFVGLNPKAYSLLLCDGARKYACKGVSKKCGLSHSDYEEVLNDQKCIYKEMVSIRSKKHEVSTETIVKLALQPYDDKRYIFDDGVTTTAIGHVNNNNV